MNGIPRGGQGGGSAGPAIPPPATPGVGSSASEATKKRGPYRPRLKGKEGAMSSAVDNPRRNAMLSAIAGGGETSIRRKGKGKLLGPGTFLPPEGEGRLLLSDPRLIDPAREKKKTSTPTRSYTVEATAFLDIVSQVHNRDTDCPANIASDESGAERCDTFNFNCWCKDCGMHFPRLKVAATPISSVVFGILMAGSNIENYCAAHNFSDIADMSRTTYYRELPKVLDAVGQVYDFVMEQQKEAFRRQGWRDVWVDTDTLYFSQHKKELEAKGEAFTGIEDGRYENSTPEDMAVGLLLTRKARNDPPAFTEVGGKTLMKGIEVAVDGSYCSRNDMSYSCNVVLSAERSPPDAPDRVTVPFDMVTLTRRTQKDAPLKEVCSLLRDGSTCFAHGSEAEWRKKVTKGTPREAYKALNVNCYSSSGIRHSLSGQAAEPQGGRLLCLRLLLSGFYVTRFKVANDVGDEMGNLFREFFTEAIELLDWAHVQRDLRCDVAKVAPGNGDRIGREFGRAVREALTESKEEGGLPWENGFVRKFAHITSHFQGDHQYCGQACGGGFDELDPEGKGNASGGVRGKGKGGAAGKISLGDCGTSALTIASARASAEDARSHFEAKQRRMDEFLTCAEKELQRMTVLGPPEATRSLWALRGSVLFAREKCAEGWSLCNGLVESLEEALCVLEPTVPQAPDRAISNLPLSALARVQGNVEGLHSWELASKEGEMGHRETDGPAYLVTRPDIQEAKLSYVEAVDAVAQAEVLYRAQTNKELAVPVHYMGQTRMGILRQELWCERQSWSFFSHCSSAEGVTQRQHHPCQVCDLQAIVQRCSARAFCFCTTSSTHSLDSLNASVSSMTTKKGDFSRSDFAHAQIAVLKRVHPKGQVGMAADVRRKLHLPELSESAAKRVRSREESYSHSKKGEKATRAPSRAATGEDLKRRRQSGVKKGKAATQEAMKLNHRAALAGSLAPAGRGKKGEEGNVRNGSELAAGVPAGLQEEGEGRGGGADGAGGGGR